FYSPVAGPAGPGDGETPRPPPSAQRPRSGRGRLVPGTGRPRGAARIDRRPDRNAHGAEKTGRGRAAHRRRLQCKPPFRAGGLGEPGRRAREAAGGGARRHAGAGGPGRKRAPGDGPHGGEGGGRLSGGGGHGSSLDPGRGDPVGAWPRAGPLVRRRSEGGASGAGVVGRGRCHFGKRLPGLSPRNRLRSAGLTLRGTGGKRGGREPVNAPIYAGLLSFFVAVLLGPSTISFLRRLKFGQHIRSAGPKAHLGKAGTPTMGGVLIVFAAVVATLVFAEPGSGTALRLILVTLAFALIGLVDDFIIVVRKRSLGLRARSKLAAQLVIAAWIALYALNTP